MQNSKAVLPAALNTYEQRTIKILSENANFALKRETETENKSSGIKQLDVQGEYFEYCSHRFYQGLLSYTN